MNSLIQLPRVTTDLSPTEQAAFLAPTLAAIADENRLAIVLSLSEGAKSNKDLQQVTGLSQALVSHHVAILLKAGLVSSTPQGRSNIISLCCEQLATPVQWLAHLATLTPEGQQACCTDQAMTTPETVPDVR